MTDEYVTIFGGVSRDLVKLSEKVFNMYDKKILESGIELSEGAMAARQRVIESIDQYRDYCHFNNIKSSNTWT